MSIERIGMKRIVFFLPFQGCMRRCVYCDQAAITGQRENGTPLRAEEVRQALARQHSPVELCFFGGSFAHLEPARMQACLDTIASAPAGSRITFSSYPGDFAGEEGDTRLALLSRYPIGTIELGIPSLDSSVLSACRRDDDPQMILNVVEKIRDAGFHVGVQSMIGLPKQTFESALRDIHTLAGLMRPGERWDLRLYPCLVLRNTELERNFRAGTYVPLALEDAVRQAGSLCFAAEKCNFRVIRVGLLESSSLRESITTGPYHPAFGELALSEKLALALADQIRRNPGTPLSIPSRLRSRLSGHGGRGMARLAELTCREQREILQLLQFTD